MREREVEVRETKKRKDMEKEKGVKMNEKEKTAYKNSFLLPNFTGITTTI